MLRITSCFSLVCLLIFVPYLAPTQAVSKEVPNPEAGAKVRMSEKHAQLLSVALHKRFGLKFDQSCYLGPFPPLMFLGFHTAYDQPVASVDEARRLIVDIGTFVLNYLNHNPEIVPYLSERPLTSEDLYFDIFFDQGLYNDETWISVTLQHGQVHYGYVYDKIKVPSETFDEAKAKVDASRAKHSGM